MGDRTGSAVAGHRQLPGATSSTVYAIELADRRTVVLRQLDNPEWLAAEPDLAEHEFTALETAARARLPAPVALAVDPHGTACGVPGVLMSHLPGRVTLPKRPSAIWIARLADSAAEIHRHQVPRLQYRYRSWTSPMQVVVPPWARSADRWKRAIDVWHEGPPRAPSVLLHRDFHPTNVLWQRGRVTGVVDWINACRGPRGVDIAHCRRNLACMYGIDTAQRFLAAYAAAVPGYRHGPFWDLDAAFDAAAHLRFYRPWAEFGLGTISRDRLEQRIETLVEYATR